MMEVGKLKFKINKNKILVITMIFMLLLCCWWNVWYKNNNNAKILGEAEFVTNEITVSEDFFTESRMEIERARDIEISHLKLLLEDENIDEQTRSSVSDAYLEIVKSIEQERICEQQIKNKIQYDVLVTVNPPQATVTVHALELLPEEVARIKEIVLTQTGLSSECIKISVTD